MAVIWIGGGLMMLIFGIRAVMSGDPSRMAVLGQGIAGAVVAGSLIFWRYRLALSQPPPAPAS